MKILLITQPSLGVKYLKWVLSYLPCEVKEISLKGYLKKNYGKHDIIIYQPSPLENVPDKFNKHLIDKTDEKFMSDKARKLLCDCHPRSSVDGFSRLNTDMPRIKRCPHKDFPNVCLPITMEIRRTNIQRHKRDILLSCKSRISTDSSRIWVREKIKAMGGVVAYDRSRDRMAYRKHLARVLISVCPQGRGETTIRSLETMWMGACMVCDESIRGAKLLPCADIVEGRDYLTFNKDNIEDVIKNLIQNKKEAERIALNGHKVFNDGYPAKKTAKLFNEFLKNW